MDFISRRLAVSIPGGKETVIAYRDFFKLKGPLIILGEPGSGKSELVKHLQTERPCRILKASSVLAFPKLPSSLSGTVVIDGLDEVTAYGIGSPISQILSRIGVDDISDYVFTCRAADWQHAVNSSIIQERWNTSITIGTLLPLTDQEIIDFVDKNGDGIIGESFVTSAYNSEAIELVRNPQTLLMLLKTVKRVGWPKSRLDLYREACKVFVEEENEIHQSLNSVRPSADVMLEVAGLICAQLLLANKSGIALGASQDDVVVAIGQVVDNAYPEDTIRRTLSSKLFRTFSTDVLEPMHRTVAEFLAAKWIASALTKSLSLKRLEHLLYYDNDIIPTALRGLHAWVASLASSEVTRSFIKKDPYGFFRYGDPSILSIQHVRELLKALQQLSETDPYFRNEDWNASFGKGWAKIELKDEIVSILKNPSTSYQVSHLILESIRGDDFANHITQELIEIVKDLSETPIERHASLGLLISSTNQPDWPDLAQTLNNYGDIQSLRLSIKIIESFLSQFSGIKIAETFILIFEANKKGNSFSGLGFDLQHSMSVDQLYDCLSALIGYEDGADDDADFDVIDDSPKDRICIILMELFVRKNPPPPLVVWNVLKKLKHYSFYRKSDFNKITEEYFRSNDNYRRDIQSKAFGLSLDRGYWLTFFDLRSANDGLTVQESDAVALLQTLEQQQYDPKFELKWRDTVTYVLRRPDFAGAAIQVIRQQSEKNPVLFRILRELESPARQEFDVEDEMERLKIEKEIATKDLERFRSYKRITPQLVAGTNLPAISQIAKAFLGHFGDIRGNNPKERVLALVGEEMVDVAMQSITSAITHNTIPTAKQIVEISAKEKKEYYLQSILVAYGYLNLSQLSTISIEVSRSILASCRWGLKMVGDEITELVRSKLEDLIFVNDEAIKTFIEDTIEPYLTYNNDHVYGLHRLNLEDKLRRASSEISASWLRNYTLASGEVFKEILNLAINTATPEGVVKILKERIESDKFSSTKELSLAVAALFLFDLHNSRDAIAALIKKNDISAGAFRTLLVATKREASLSSEHNHFLILTFANSVTSDAAPPNGFYGDDHPWEVSRFLLERIKSLLSRVDDRTTELMKDLLDHPSDLGTYVNDVKHAYSQHLRFKAEGMLRRNSIEVVRSILLDREPINHEDLQALILDQLDLLQRRIKSSQTDDYLVFWNNNIPHDENYCRDRIVASITPYLDRYHVRVHIEAAMPNNKRCDFINTHLNIDLPVEVKGQWHKDVWASAISQLTDYSIEYRADGFGVFLVLWFGANLIINAKNPYKWEGRSPQTIAEMSDFLDKAYKNKLSAKTKLVLLDLSKP